MKKIIVLFMILLIELFGQQDPKLENLSMFRFRDGLRITFNEPMDSSVLNLNNYSLATLSLSANFSGVVPHLISVTQTNNDLSIIEISTTLLPNGVYRLDVQNVKDISGNLIDPYFSSFAFLKNEAGIQFIIY